MKGWTIDAIEDLKQRKRDLQALHKRLSACQDGLLSAAAEVSLLNSEDPLPVLDLATPTIR